MHRFQTKMGQRSEAMSLLEVTAAEYRQSFDPRTKPSLGKVAVDLAASLRAIIFRGPYGLTNADRHTLVLTRDSITQALGDWPDEEEEAPHG